MKLKKLVALALTATMLVGCGGGSGSSDENAISIDLTQEPPQMNSILTSSTGSGNVLRHCMEGLVSLDENSEPVPGMAESWDVSEDYRTVTFHLRKGAKWSSGEEVTAKDFVFALDQLFTTSNAAPYSGSWAPRIVGAEDYMAATEKLAEAESVLSKAKKDKGDTSSAEAAVAAAEAEVARVHESIGYKAVDDYTLTFNLTGPYEYFVALTAFYNFLPVNEKQFNELGGIESYATEADKMVYNGPFVITDWTHEDSIVLEKNPDYWDADSIKLDKITFRMIKDSNTRLNEYQAGSIDVIELIGDQVQDLQKEDQYKDLIKEFDDGSNFYLQYNVTRPGLNNANIRKAITYAVDAQQFIDSIVKNGSTVANSFTPPAINNGEFTASVGDVYHRDSVDPKALLEQGLAETGLTVDELKFTMIADDTDSAKTYAAFVQEQVKSKLGVNIEVKAETYKARINDMNNHNFDIVFAGWGPDYNDPMTFLDLFVTGAGNNSGLYSNPTYDSLVEQANAEADQTRRNELMVQIEQILAQDCPIGYVYNRKKSYITSERVKGLVRTAFSDIDARHASVK